MARKVFLSFLGITYYNKTKYYFQSKSNYYETRFIQEATLKLIAKDWTKDDSAYIFLTDKAKNKNWITPAQQDDYRVKNGERDTYLGLEKRLKDLPMNIVPIYDLPEGNSEQEIWEIFHKVFNVLLPNDELYFDITHAFRSIPMLVMVLINYAKLIKNVKVRMITYGNYEGRDPEQNLAPIIDLTAFSHLQDWTIAANNFIKYGTVSDILSLIQNKKDFEPLDKLIKNIYAVRGKEIIKAALISPLKKALKRNGSEQEPFNVLKQKILEHIVKFKENKINNGFAAVEFCINHNLIQQGITLLEEFIITKILSEIGFEHKIYSYRYRNVVSKALENDSIDNIEVKELIAKNDKKQEKRTKEFKDILDKVFNLPYKKKLTEVYKEFAMDIRNDINHAGFRDNPKSTEELKVFLENSFNAVKNIFEL